MLRRFPFVAVRNGQLTDEAHAQTCRLLGMNADTTQTPRRIERECMRCRALWRRILQRALPALVLAAATGAALHELSGRPLALVLGVSGSVVLLALARDVYCGVTVTEFALNVRGVFGSRRIDWVDCGSLFIVPSEKPSMFRSGPYSMVQFALYMAVFLFANVSAAVRGLGVGTGVLGRVGIGLVLGFGAGALVECVAWTSLRFAALLRTGVAFVVVTKAGKAMPVRVWICPHARRELADLARDKGVDVALVRGSELLRVLRATGSLPPFGGV